MSLSAFKVISVLMLLAKHCTVGSCFQPSYQVSLYLNSNGRSAPVHYCNGVIVQSRLVLTAASCIYYQPVPNGPLVRIKPQRIIVVAGADGESFEESNTFKVMNIEIAKDFNQTSLANDLALLRLEKFVPLGTRNDISWIILDEYDPQYDTEVLRASFPSLSGTHVQMEKLPITKSNHCNVRPNDICSLYPATKAKANCKALANFPVLNGDRGAGLISRSHLIGIFSTVEPLSTGKVDNCTLDKPPTALFTNLSTHLDWVYDVIANDEHLTDTENNIAFSAPYQEPETVAVHGIGTEGQNSSVFHSATKVPHSQALISASDNLNTSLRKILVFVIFVNFYTLLF